MFDVIVDQNALGDSDCFFNSKELLGNVGGRGLIVQHLYDLSQVTICPFEPCRDLWMRIAGVQRHIYIPIPPIWILSNAGDMNSVILPVALSLRTKPPISGAISRKGRPSWQTISIKTTCRTGWTLVP